jgi:phosphoribosylformimino-5-aminoimidazole carboxamide ribotide isomerase
MIVYPALDLMDGRAVRLEQGRFEAVRAYSATPREALERFAASGALWAHVVDLDGARSGAPVQHDLIASLASSVPLRLQVAGGFRSRDQILRMFERGVARVVIGSLAVRQPETVGRWIAEFGPDRIVLSFDVRLAGEVPRVAVSGWTEDSGRSLWEVAALFPEARHLLVTDIGRDGMLKGPNFDLYEELSSRLANVAVQASGGVSSLDDLRDLSAAGAIVGKALWERRFTLEDALSIAGS